MKVAAIVTTFNRVKLLKECITRLLNQSYKLNDIFVINNDSHDGTKDYLKSIKSSVIHPINLNKNLGGAGGFSLGTQIAFEKSDADYFWIMDDDTMTATSTLNRIMISGKKLGYDFGFLCSNVRWWKNKRAAVTNVPQVANDWNQSLIDNLIKLRSTSFVSVLFPRVLVKRVGLPISDMFIWGDDVEFTTRLSNANSRCYMVKDSLVFHKSVKNKTYSLINSDRINFYKYGIRNKIFIDRKYYNIKSVIKFLITYMFILIKIPFLSKNKRCERIYMVLRGIIAGFFFNPRIKFPK